MSTGMAEKHALIGGQIVHPKQMEALSDVNLVSADFEKQYREGLMKGRRRRVGSRVVWGVLAALAAWLLALTVVRELQLARLRGDLRALADDVLVLSATVRALTDKIDNNKLLNDLQQLDDDTIYADNDLNDDLDKPGRKSEESDSLEKLFNLTKVLEDDTESRLDDDMFMDDEDEDEDDGGSGDYYRDYDTKRDKIGKSDMVRLRPEDFTDTVLFNKDTASSDIREIQRQLNENPEKDIDAGSWQTMPNEVNKMAAPDQPESAQARDRRSVIQNSDYASPNVIASDTDRRKAKKMEVESSEYKPAPAHTNSRTARNSEMGQRRPFIAAHFHGNTSHLSPGVHEHYRGNGLVRVPHGAAHSVWSPAAWTAVSPHPRPTLTRSGHVHVHHAGVYLVYAQIYYLDQHDLISWVLHRSNPDREGSEALLQCAQSAHSVEPMEKPNSCFSASALFLRAGDRLALRNTGGDRHSLMQPEKSFIGLVKLADAEDPDEDY